MAVDKVLTPELMYRAAIWVAAIDAGFVALLWWRVGADGLRRAKWPIAAVAGLFWLAVWATMHVMFWDRVYSHVFPSWSRWVMPLVFGVGYAALALFWRSLALRGGRLAVLAWVLLWGATGALTHTWAVYGRGLLASSPMLQQLTPLSAIVFATFEFGFYGCVILTVASRLQGVVERRRRPAGPHGPVL
jgi:hypothetical protein